MIEIYKDLKSPVRSIEAKVEVFDTSTNAFLNTYSGDDILKAITVERLGEKKFFGFGVCQKANIKLLDIHRALNITTDNAFKIYFDDIDNLPDFYTTEVHRDENTNELSITAYDALYEPGFTFADLELVAPYSVEDVAAAIAARMGLNLALINIPYEDTTTGLISENGANFEGTEGIREVLNDIAEVLLAIYYIGADKKLVFKRLNKDAAADYTIDKASYFALDNGDNRRLTALVSATELGDNIEASLEMSGTTQYIRDNAFIDLRGDIPEILYNALSTIGGLTINQFNCNWRGNYGLEIGDKIALEAKDNSLLYSYLLEDTINFEGVYSHTSGWSYEDNEGETASNAANLGEALKQTFAKVDKANKQIEIVASETDEVKSNISSLQLTTSNINASVSSINKDINELTKQVNASVTSEELSVEIQKEIANGVEKVTTTTGFTFNDEGLTVSKTGSEMTTQITEDGMIVSRSSGEVLTADNKGVKAENLHATTYLIVGVNSRFENYDNGSRTGCFWIG